MSRTDYSTMQIPRTTKLRIEDFRRRNGYSSNSKALTALDERRDVAKDIKTNLVKESRQTSQPIFYTITDQPKTLQNLTTQFFLVSS